MTLSLSSVAEQKTLNVCYEDSYYLPYTTPQKETEKGNPGFIIELINQAAQKLDLTIQYERHPWKRCIHLLKDNKVDGLFPVTKTPERTEWGAFPKNQHHILWPSTYAVFTEKNSNLAWDGTSFSNVRHGISGPYGYVVTKQLDTMGVLPDNVTFPNKGLLMVARKRLDGYVVEEHVGWFIAQQVGIDSELKTLDISFLSAQWHMALSKQFYQQHPKLSEALWQQLDAIRNTPNQALKEKYKMADYQHLHQLPDNQQ